MSDFMTTYFGPLDKNSCVYFLILTMIFFAVLVFTMVGELLAIVKRWKELDMRMVTGGVLLLFNAFIAYFVDKYLDSINHKCLFCSFLAT